MKFQSVILLTLLLSFSSLLAQKKGKEFNPAETFPKDSLVSWTKAIFKEVSDGHPGFYRYTTKPRFDYLIDSAIQEINGPLNTLQYYRIIKPLFAQIGCLHTAVTLSDQYEKHINTNYKLFPFEVFINPDKSVFITKNHSDNQAIPIESKLLSINNKPIDWVLKKIMSAIPSDGRNESLKMLLLNHNFAFWYESMIELNTNFSIKIKTDEGIQTYKISGVKKEVFPTYEQIEKADEQQIKFTIKDNIAFLTIHSFAKTIIKKNKQNFTKRITQIFKTLNEKQVSNLVIDLRYNSGGTDGNAAFLTSHFFDQPFEYWEKIEITEYMAKQLKGLARVFYSKPEKVDTSYHFKGALLTNEFNYYKTQKPSDNNYKGNTYILTNGLCMSSCSDVVAILSDNKKAIVIGQETGGGFQGNTSGLMPEVETNTNMVITVPLNKYTNAVNPSKNIGRGTIPDHIIQPTLIEWMKQKDVQMEYVLQLIEQGKS